MRKHHNRLYYGKYEHKTTFKLPHSNLFYPTTDENLDALKQQHKDADELILLADIIMKNRKNMKFRIQENKSIFYTDKNMAHMLITRFWDYWTGHNSIDPKFKGLDANTVGCTRLPHGKYQYQVFLKKDAQSLISDAQRTDLWNYLERNVDHCLVRNYAILDYLEKKSPYCFGGYFYVKEEKFLTPIFMMAQQAIDRVIKFRKVKNGSNKKVKR